jgi:formylglycine-generating enzyme required for sulfatase activity
MSGNVSEWVWDPNNASDTAHRVIKGGGWESTAKGCKIASRNYYLAYYNIGRVGFRCVIQFP